MYEEVVIIKGKKKGPTSIIIGGIHGDEVCGVKAIQKIVPVLKIDAGKVIFVYGNPKAIEKDVRYTGSNLNRLFRAYSSLSKQEKASYEYRRSLILKKYLRQANFLLDIHASFTPKSRRFIICENNAKGISKYLPYNLVVSGFDKVQPGGTDYYMNSIGKIGICVECGAKSDLKSTKVAEQSIIEFLKATKNITAKPIERKQKKKIVIYKLYKARTNSFSLSKNYEDFERVRKNRVIGFDGGVAVKTQKDSIILFAQNTKKAGEEVYLLGKKNRK